MDPFRYRKAYEALTYHCQQVESLLSQSVRLQQSALSSGGATGWRTDDEQNSAGSEQDGLDTEAATEHEDPDGMEWTPTATPIIPVKCEPSSVLPDQARHLPPSRTDDSHTVNRSNETSAIVSRLQGGVLVDKSIEKLVQVLPHVLNYDGPKIFTPSTIEVPKDFGMQMSISINHHLALVADRKILEKYRRLLGHRRTASKRKHIRLGFNPVQIIKKQALVLPDDVQTKSSTLNNDIHSIFRPENFHGCPDDIYEQLKPALRLATLLILHRATSSFWHTLLFGERELCRKATEQYGQECWRIRDDVPWSAEQAACMEQFLNSQVDTVHFLFHKQPLPPDPHYASMGLVADYKNGLRRQIDGKCHKSKICLHTDFYTTAKRLSLLQYPDPAMVLRFNLFLAICLAHEMAHFIEVSGPHNERPLGRPEVFFHDNIWTESGIAFELKVFGGRVHPISLRIDCGLGLAILNYPLKEIYEREDNILYTVPMDYVARIQQQETWDQDYSKADPTVFHIPRNGTRSTELNGTNLMIWEDEKDADISDKIDGKDTTFHRMDDGQIVRNLSNNRRPVKLPEVRRWGPYNRPRSQNMGIETCVSPKTPDSEKDEAEETEETDTTKIVDEDAMA